MAKYCVECERITTTNNNECVECGCDYLADTNTDYHCCQCAAPYSEKTMISYTVSQPRLEWHEYPCYEWHETHRCFACGHVETIECEN